MTQAKNGDTVRINYTGRLADGTQFDASGGEPLQFTLGEGQVIPGLETHVEGMEVGEKNTVTVPADAAYGPHRPEAVLSIERVRVPDNININIGTQLQARTREGRPMQVTVVGVDDARVKLDGNHPLAGKDLIFDVELVEIVQAA
ncbi:MULTISPECIES: peptidylprolyl isomerase [unclassified Mesorhizobium]|uniref:FKBP-type peptidyl-prolyl cis-trans isomerase n=1 Tax=unclassified Mesorhizobium TaxID=325217 RepID=UPI001129FA82|nr:MULTISPECIES: peptidylprolyl isomerase [unclassified Mesorhizobium]MBZ9894643.1 peptidylprolyl isomerase [Mesorhizobium sp. BR1-1-6]MBZ9982512.1 peptidylprolyl isomerase [Mesorhizobium sp. BR-1-1-8]TPL32234.1 peptidylprolyl isomerase [Mesorhizobium sp. B2-4-8]TPL61187.1 peptidylprolyl isomerase [Mesorhizobium sp. B2-4-1]TPM57424.1 peptidylprolyl isomerase [Mesorhizobium sp. B2-2-4]